MCYSESTKSKVVENTSEIIKDKVKRATNIENALDKKKIQEKLPYEVKDQITADDLTNPSKLLTELFFAFFFQGSNDEYSFNFSQDALLRVWQLFSDKYPII